MSSDVCTYVVFSSLPKTLGIEKQGGCGSSEARNAELAVINSIQQAVGAELDFQAIVDLVGDKLREVFATGDIGIRWWDENTELWHGLYDFEHGVRLHMAPRRPPGRPPAPCGSACRCRHRPSSRGSAGR